MFSFGLSFGGADASEIERTDSIPEEFHGTWASDASHCNKLHELNLRIGPTSLNFWESSGEAISIVIKDKRELAMILDFSGEGEEWIGFVHFRISEDGNLLEDIEKLHLENRITRVKC